MGSYGSFRSHFRKKNNSIKYNLDKVIFEVKGHNRVAFWGILNHAGAEDIGLFRNQFINCKKFRLVSKILIL